MASNPTDTADPVSNAVIRQEVSLFLRQLLQTALQNAAGSSPAWAAQAQALLANVLMNDYLNWWNNVGQPELTAAQTAVDQAKNLNPSNTALALAHHAQGLIYRSQGNHKSALSEFEQAVSLDAGFARARAQIGNQKILLGQEDEAQQHLDQAIKLNPHHPAIGYFYWAKGRGYFQQEKWADAIAWLAKSVQALPTVWYNRCYLAAAQDGADDAANKAQAQDTIQDFLNDQRFGRPGLVRALASLQPNANDSPKVAAARKRVYDFLKQF
ncbi:MAG: tetratricopeptide repeat protein [Alphaproteobacteria bacterium]|nr:tetratricopeptide repeat protein [Alphaproteobacteria bacterium]